MNLHQSALHGPEELGAPPILARVKVLPVCPAAALKELMTAPLFNPARLEQRGGHQNMDPMREHVDRMREQEQLARLRHRFPAENGVIDEPDWTGALQ